MINSVFYLVLVSILAANCLKVDELNEREFAQQALDAVNYIRSLHDCKPLLLVTSTDKDLIAKELATEANNAAQSIVNGIHHNDGDIVRGLEETDTKGLDHESFGALIAVMSADEYARLKILDGGIAARFWYKREFPLHDFVNNKYHMETAHLTQMIWKESVNFSVATRFTDDEDLVMVYMFDPYGNFESHTSKFTNQVADVDPKRKFEDFLNDAKLFRFPDHGGRSWYDYDEDYKWEVPFIKQRG